MASVCSGEIEFCTDGLSESTMDERELTLAGRDFVPPQFSPVRRPALSSSRMKTRRYHSDSVISTASTPPRSSVEAPDKLRELELDPSDLESTIVAGGNESASIVVANGSHSSSGGGEYGGLSSSYMQAVTGGRLTDSTAVLRKSKSKKSKRRSIVSGLLHSSSNPDLPSASIEDIDTKNLASAKMLRRELLGLELEDVEENVDLTDILFSVVQRPYKKEKKRSKVLATLLIYGNVDINARAPSGMTALHYAVQDCDVDSVRTLVAFGANINATNQFGKTPMEMLQSEDPTGGADASKGLYQTMRKHWQATWENKVTHRLKCLEFLRSMGATGHEMAQRISVVPSVPSFPHVPSSSGSGSSSNSPATLPRHPKAYEAVLDWSSRVTSRYRELEQSIRNRLDNTTDAGDRTLFSGDTAVSLALQLHEMRLFQRSGSRVLCLDGGGIRGLVQLEILCQLEKKTGRKIVDLFDWIIGTSTGAIIALGLVYAQKSLTQLRQLYFRLKDEVFGKTKGGGMSFNTAGLEKILKEVFTEHMCMDDHTYPRVLISAVKKEHINLKLRYFNNCFNDEFCRHMLVWKVARYTCAAPVLFGESDQYVDGGLLANNPSDSGLSRIQSHYRSRGEKLPISLVVSVGTGKYPSQALGSVDFLFVGAQGWSSLSGTSNLMELLSYALVEPSVADDNCRCRCEEEGIRYFRLNPRMEMVIGSGETDTETLINMVLQTSKEMEDRPELANLVLCLHDLARVSNKCHTYENGDFLSSDRSIAAQ